MKKPLITLLSIASFCIPLHAEDENSNSGPRDHKPPRAEGERRNRGERPDFKSLTSEERIAVLKGRMKRNLKMAEMVTKRFDADESGTLSDTELTAAAEAMAKRVGRRGDERARRRGPGGDDAKGRRGPGRGKRPDSNASDSPESSDS